jgi:hypothetical protein
MIVLIRTIGISLFGFDNETHFFIYNLLIFKYVN